MFGFLKKLPDWFNPWGWTALGILAIILLLIALVLVIKAGRKKKTDVKGESSFAEDPAALTEDKHEEIREPVETQPQPVEEQEVEQTQSEPEPAVEREEEKPAAKAAANEIKAETKSATEQFTTDKKEGKPVEKQSTNEKKAAEKPASKTAAAEKNTQAKPAAKPVAGATKKSDYKPSNKTYHISKRSDLNRWQIKAAGGAKALKFFNTQAEAIEYAKTLAKNQDAHIVIHKEDGSFRKLNY